MNVCIYRYFGIKKKSQKSKKKTSKNGSIFFRIQNIYFFNFLYYFELFMIFFFKKEHSNLPTAKPLANQDVPRRAGMDVLLAKRSVVPPARTDSSQWRTDELVLSGTDGQTDATAADALSRSYITLIHFTHILL